MWTFSRPPTSSQHARPHKVHLQALDPRSTPPHHHHDTIAIKVLTSMSSHGSQPPIALPPHASLLSSPPILPPPNLAETPPFRLPPTPGAKGSWSVGLCFVNRGAMERPLWPEMVDRVSLGCNINTREIQVTLVKRFHGTSQYRPVTFETRYVCRVLRLFYGIETLTLLVSCLGSLPFLGMFRGVEHGWGFWRDIAYYVSPSLNACILSLSLVYDVFLCGPRPSISIS
ncbi:hypothetical protein G7K_6242-t1 [Saitoella complicata NRRL Y-17804]|uniref:Uncharacterized protein n=1 Tax=Saitoella complicata (strain BCRC 22490 / CBS 7301 / JCM 7358 / NBRC 10748 / NRRL Y-17804) TaxID=698492 RepID=A0A0E9NR58_SAICN|nr:hypothetical protein G7K_6242-t1 [Saitoella complicata NRRL Y-17804]